jgi:integrase
MIVKRGNSYGVSVYDASLGKKRWIGTFPTKAEARAVEREAARRPRGGSRITCGELAETWLEDHSRPSPTTQQTYGYALNRFVADFRNRKLIDIDVPTARAWAKRNANSNARVVRTMFNDAIADGIHPGPNPFANLRLPQSRGRKDLVPITAAEVFELVDIARAIHSDTNYRDEIGAIIQFAAFVGLRPGELFALQPGDIGETRVRIERSADNGGRIKAPKNGRSREVVLPPPAREALSVVPGHREWLFCSPRGNRLTRNSLYYWWRPVVLAAGRPGMHFYELRHFCATHLLELGLSPSDVAVQLGHTDNGALVMSTYGHPSDERARERILQAYVGSQVGGK